MYLHIPDVVSKKKKLIRKFFYKISLFDRLNCTYKQPQKKNYYKKVKQASAFFIKLEKTKVSFTHKKVPEVNISSMEFSKKTFSRKEFFKKSLFRRLNPFKCKPQKKYIYVKVHIAAHDKAFYRKNFLGKIRRYIKEGFLRKLKYLNPQKKKKYSIRVHNNAFKKTFFRKNSSKKRKKFKKKFFFSRLNPPKWQYRKKSFPVRVHISTPRKWNPYRDFHTVVELSNKKQRIVHQPSKEVNYGW